MDFGLLFRGANFFTTDISHTFLPERDEIYAGLEVWPIKTHFPNFMNFGPGVP